MPGGFAPAICAIFFVWLYNNGYEVINKKARPGICYIGCCIGITAGYRTTLEFTLPIKKDS